MNIKVGDFVRIVDPPFFFKHPNGQQFKAGDIVEVRAVFEDGIFISSNRKTPQIDRGSFVPPPNTEFIFQRRVEPLKSQEIIYYVS